MRYKLSINNQEIIYNIKKSKRAKNLRLCVCSDTSVVITMPRLFPRILAKNFLIKKADWVIKKIEYYKKHKRIVLSSSDYLEKKEQARKALSKKIKEINKNYNFKFNKIAVRNQKTRWGSCSSKRNLNFSYKIIYLPAELQDYIITHELCHLLEFNHSRKFWKLVAKTIPDYSRLRKELKKQGISLG
ncbi:M48 family metallopeptidase [Candidatus Parcubacteria bacterium]|nr:M48 family metallopeptidase [Candidatus Parcubacteria bacterium]